MRAKVQFVGTTLLLFFPILSYAQVATYLPVEVGNSWTYVNDAGATRVFTVVGELEIKGLVYYEYDDFFTPCGFPGWSDGEESRHLYRGDRDAQLLFQYDPATGNDVVRFDFSGKQWGPFGNQLTDRDFEYQTPAGAFGDSVRFDYATLVDCGVFHEILAPDIGTVGFSSSWEGEYRLQSYSVVPEPEASLGLIVGLVVIAYCRRSMRDPDVPIRPGHGPRLKCPTNSIQAITTARQAAAQSQL